MGLGELTKQIAQKALLDAATTKEPPAPVAAAAPPDPTGAALLSQLGSMQKALKEDEELMVHIQAAGDKLRVVEIFLPSPQAAVVSAVDANRALVRIVAPVHALQFICRVAKVPPGAKPARVGLVTQKPKDSSS